MPLKGSRWLVVVATVSLIWGLAAVGTAGVNATPLPPPTPTHFPRCDFTPVPNAGPPGTLVVLRGICYPIHSGRQGAIFFDDTVMAHVQGETAGDYGGGFYVPADATIGTHQLSLRYGADGSGSVIASATFDVLPFCRGDCDDSGRVTVAELLRGVNIALGKLEGDACPALDVDRDGTISVNELVAAVSDALTGCLVAFTPTATPRDTPTPVSVGGPCRATVECEQDDLLCVEPGGFAGCVECRLESDECAFDSDCAGRGELAVCDLRPMLGPDCFCQPTRRCIAGCTSNTDCAEGERCDARAHCTAITCAADDQCPEHFYCHLSSGRCARRYCVQDAECPTGFCVEYGCHGVLGVCVYRPGLPLSSRP